MKTYADYLYGIFGKGKVQKISIDAGFSCPNRDGSIGTTGCIYCRNDSFSPNYCSPKISIKEQLEKGKNFFSRKYPEMKYLAYFQSYTGTYNRTLDQLSKMYKEAIEGEDIIGLVIATRPDCISETILKLLSALNREKPVFIELGAESSHNKTLKLINRNHTWEAVVDAVERVTEHSIHCGLHLIAGLPGENRDMILTTIDRTIKLPIETIKLHQLQILKETPLHQKIETGEITVPNFTLEEYLDLCVEIIKRVPENIIIERFLSQAPSEMIISPSWGLKNFEFMAKLANCLQRNNVKN